ncbi:DUF1811 family protein [Paenibacillus sp.]|uniref:DUF1811 family protein n=1 Tax=Paenibacillus sp. TaxID=58172 RepID=UPI002D496B7E|nr:DUF1811 family protein [Paenibacillus sp.]HZG85468.1 DUF1811 family protein [Paenibacillus sp.]
MKRFSEMTEDELRSEIDRLAKELEASRLEGERDVLRQKWLMARSYAARSRSFPPGRYRVEDADDIFTLRYVNGVMGWGVWGRGGEETALPLAVLTPEDDAAKERR